MPELWIIRHGETEWSLAGRHTGRTDLPLTANGERQAAELRARLAAVKFSRVRVSPLRRARQTCELAGLGADAQVDPDLLEFDYGDYEGKTHDEIQVQHPGWNLWKNGVRGGETLEAVGLRADHLLASVASETGRIALVAHGHVLRILAARWLKLPPDGGRYLVLEPTSVCVLGDEHGLPVWRIWNGAR